MEPAVPDPEGRDGPDKGGVYKSREVLPSIDRTRPDKHAGRHN